MSRLEETRSLARSPLPDLATPEPCSAYPSLGQFPPGACFDLARSPPPAFESFLSDSLARVSPHLVTYRRPLCCDLRNSAYDNETVLSLAGATSGAQCYALPTSAPTPAPSPLPTTPSPTNAHVSVMGTNSMSGFSCSEFGSEEEASFGSAVASSIDAVETHHITVGGCTDTTSTEVSARLLPI